MNKDGSQGPAEQALFAGAAWFDPLEAGIRDRTCGLIEELVEQELEAALGAKGRHARGEPETWAACLSRRTLREPMRCLPLLRPSVTG